MTIVRCPRCRDEVTVPPKATGRALVRCPLCLEEYLLAEALANAPPPLVIIGGEVEQAAIDSSATADNEYQLAGGGFAGGVLDASAPGAASAIAPRPGLRTMTRPRRKEPSALVFLINVVGGGVVAAPLALLALWWGFRKDPLELGPPIAQYAPWIVPQQFRGKLNGSAEDATTIRPSRPAPSTAAEVAIPSNKKTTAAAESKDANAELHSLPGLDEPAKLPDAALPPVIEAPSLNERGSAGETKLNDRRQRSETAPATVQDRRTADGPVRPMPDLTDLLPDGPFVVAPTPAPKPD